MAKPIINKIQPFDANRPYEISLSWNGNRAHANRILIYDNGTNNLVFDDTVSSFALKHIIPANTLTNGKKYVIQAQTYDVENIASPLSDKVLFYTFETPDFYFNNIPENGKVTNASFSASIYYYSSDWEDINTYIFYLYDSTKKQLLESNILNDSFDISYNYRGLENNTFYYIRCLGVTVNGMELDTGYIEISVKYENPNTYSRIYSTALPSQGSTSGFPVLTAFPRLQTIYSASIIPGYPSALYPPAGSDCLCPSAPPAPFLSFRVPSRSA